MKIYLEIAIIVTIILIYTIWKVWFEWSKNKLIKEYKPENDKARRIEGQRGIGSFEKTDISSTGTTKPTERELLEISSSESLGKDSNGFGICNRSNQTIRKFFNKLKGKK